MAAIAAPPAVQDFFGVDLDAGGDAWASFVHGWASFTDWRVILPLAVNVLLAILLVLPLVHGQRRLGHGHSLARIDEQGSYLLLAAVSAAIAVLVLQHPAMALVVFGMGGLLRFRTRTDTAQATGKAVFVVVIGLACGLGLYALAVIISAIGYVGMYWVGLRYGMEVTVRNLSAESLEKSLLAYRAVFEGYGVRLGGIRTSVAGDRFTMVLLVPRAVSPHAMAESLKLKVPDDLRGKMRADLGD